jgi:hypothetical protein
MSQALTEELSQVLGQLQLLSLPVCVLLMCPEVLHWQ